jgi:hypothetical protein
VSLIFPKSVSRNVAGSLAEISGKASLRTIRKLIVLVAVAHAGVTPVARNSKLQWSIHYGTRRTHFRHNLTTLEFNKEGSGVGG